MFRKGTRGCIPTPKLTASYLLNMCDFSCVCHTSKLFKKSTGMLTVYGTLFHQRTYTSVGQLGKTSHAIILSVQATYRCSSSVWWPNVCLMSKCCLKPTSVVRVWWARSGLCSELWRSVFIILLSHAYTSQDQPLRPEALSRKTPFGLLVSTLCLPSGKC